MLQSLKHRLAIFELEQFILSSFKQLLFRALKQKEGPAPGHYESYKKSEVNKCLQTTAPFKSKTPRFLKPQLQVRFNMFVSLIATQTTKCSVNGA